MCRIPVCCWDGILGAPHGLPVRVFWGEISAFLEGGAPRCEGCRGADRSQGMCLWLGLSSAWHLRTSEPSVLLKFSEGILLKTSLTAL